MTDPQTAADAAERADDAELVEILLDHGIHVDGRCGACRGLPAALLAWREADRKRMAAELEQVRGALLARLGDAYTSGWYDAIAAVRTPDMYQREEAWTAYRVAREKAWGLATCPAATPTPTGDARTPEQWCAEYGIDIADPDGWRGRNDPPWDEPITLPDFLRRAAVLTTRGLTPDLWNRLSREAHEAADAEATASAARDATERGAAPEGSVS